MGALFAPQNLDAGAAMIWTWSAAFLPRLAAALAILFAGALIARWASRVTAGIARRTGRLDPTIGPIVGSCVRYAILILVAIVALSQLGVQTASLFAVLGAAGLAVGLALQGTLSNIAAGIMLLWLRPFQVGDTIEVITGNPISGTVKEIGLFACWIENYDGALVFAPNSTIWNFALRNHSRNGARLVSFSVALPQKADVERAKAILLETLSGDSRALASPAPDVFVDRLDDNGEASLVCRLWTAPANVGEAQRSVIAEARRRLEQADSGDLAPRRIARLAPPDSDPSRLMAS